MLYITYLPKSKGEPVGERKINQMLKWYADLTGDKYSVISAPGYLSRTASSTTDFLRELRMLLSSKSKRKIGFLNGMNGHHTTLGGTNTIIDENNGQLCSFNFDQIKL